MAFLPTQQKQLKSLCPMTGFAKRGGQPKVITFITSIIIALIALVIHCAHIQIPHVHSGFVILLVGYLVLVAGNLLKGV
jgi:hypothetical protein